MLFLKNSYSQNWDWSHVYRTCYSENALDYVIEQTNVTRRTEGGGITYWCPINNNQESRITKKFNFTKNIGEAFLKVDYIYIANFSATQFGGGSLWASKDGNNWVEILDAPRPQAIASGYKYSNSIPASLLGTKELWIQVRMKSQGWNIMSQFLRYHQNERTDNSFELKVKALGDFRWEFLWK